MPLKAQTIELMRSSGKPQSNNWGGEVVCPGVKEQTCFCQPHNPECGIIEVPIWNEGAIYPSSFFPNNTRSLVEAFLYGDVYITSSPCDSHWKAVNAFAALALSSW